MGQNDNTKICKLIFLVIPGVKAFFKNGGLLPRSPMGQRGIMVATRQVATGEKFKSSLSALSSLIHSYGSSAILYLITILKKKGVIS